MKFSCLLALLLSAPVYSQTEVKLALTGAAGQASPGLALPPFEAEDPKVGADALLAKELREELTAYTETVKSSQGDMSKLSAKLDDIGAQLSGKVAALGQTITQAQTTGLVDQKAALAEVKREGGATDAFVNAEKRLQSKDYGQAAKGFELYLKDYPKGELTDVATYDLGLAYFGLKQWEKAGRQFALVLDKYPKSGQTPGARLHYALSLINLKKGGDEARAYLESVQADFPKSAEAKEAAAVLKRLAKPKK